MFDIKVPIITKDEMKIQDKPSPVFEKISKREDKQEGLTAMDAMRLNRHERRRLGKANMIKIPSSNKPFVKNN